MTAFGWIRIAVLLATAAACGQAPPVLKPLPNVDGNVFEPSVREAIEAAHRRLQAAQDRQAGSRELAEAYGELGMVYQVHDAPNAAEVAYQDATLLSPHDRRWPYLLGHLYNDTARQSDAIKSFEAALAIDPDDLPTLASLAEVSRQHGDLDRARSLYERLLQHGPAKPVALAGLGLVAVARHDYRSAIAPLEECLRLTPTAYRLRTPLAAAYRATGHPKEAGDLLRGPRTVDVEPEVPDPLADVLDSKVASSRGLLRRGQRFAASGLFEAAVQTFEAARKADPDNAETMADLGIAYANLGESVRAAEVLAEALRMDDGNAAAHLSLGVVLDRQGREDEALSQYRATLAIAPTNAEAAVYLADALMRRQDPRAAATYYAEALAAAPNPRIRFSLALAQIRAGEPARAIALLEEGLRDAPDSRPLVSALARVLATTPRAAGGDAPRALRLARDLFRRADDTNAAQTYAMAMAATGDYQQAAALQRTTLARLVDDRQRPFVQQNLDRYRAGRPAAAAWALDDSLFLPRSPTVRTR